LLDDQAFSRAWVENRNTFRPRSKSALRMELRRKGISDELIQTTLEDQVDEEALALEAARKQARRYAALEWPDFRRKLGEFLARRGFSYTILAPVVSQVWKENQTADAREKLDLED
jgi:regulatory protein